MTFVSFDSFNRQSSWSGRYEQTRSVLIANALSQVVELMDYAEQEARRGHWAAVMLSYESAPAFDPKITTHSSSEFPLAWAAIFDGPVDVEDRSRGAYEITSWSPLITPEYYSKAIDEIRELIRDGETYQVNYTFPLRCNFSGDAYALYRDLGAAQGASFSAYLDLGRYKVLSLSPELFFERTGDKLIVRPMKGTMPRGRWAEEDDEQALRLASCEKNRAENVMIVDLLRNDLGRISRFGSVNVTSLFAVERYNTLLQMTSTIESNCMPNTSLVAIMAALFPCGSITGAPKISTTEIINRLEPHPRGVYTGAIGLIRPGGDCVFNVAIRTLTLDSDTSEATFGVGGGITYDSNAHSEYEECVLKSRFLQARGKELDLIETILLEDGQFFLVDRHICRLKASARYFEFELGENEVRSILQSIRADYEKGRWKVRLLLSRAGAISTSVNKLENEEGNPVKVAFATRPVDRKDPFLYHKTTNRQNYDLVAREDESVDELLFWNEDGEVTESSVANIVAVTKDGKWTPPQSSGLLRGTFRDELLSRGEIAERVIHKDELPHAESIFLINSVRKWRRAKLLLEPD